MAKSQPERVRDLEDNVRDLGIKADLLDSQVEKLMEYQTAIDSKFASLGDKLSVQSTDLAVLRQRLDEQSRRLDDQAAHFKVWDQRWWGLLAGVVVAIVTAFIRK